VAQRASDDLLRLACSEREGAEEGRRRMAELVQAAESRVRSLEAEAESGRAGCRQLTAEISLHQVLRQPWECPLPHSPAPT
jgi:hypothetical protein